MVDLPITNPPDPALADADPQRTIISPSPVFQPLRIAIVGMGGVTELFHNWPERVIGRALVEQGHYVANVGYHQPSQPALRERSALIDGIEVRRVPVRHWPNTALYKALDELGPFDVIHLLHPRNVLAYGTTRWAAKHRIPTVYTWLGPFHDRYLIDDRERPYDETPHYERLIWSVGEVLRRTVRDGRLRDHLRNYWLHQPLRAATTLLPCSEHEATIMRAMGMPQPQTVVPLWIDPENVPPPATAPVPELPTLPHPALLFIGQLTPRKGYDLLVQAMPAVVKAHPTATLQIVSGLNEADRLAMEQLAESMGVREQIVFRGRVDAAELVNLFRASDVYVTPTRYEGFGLTLLEAMAAPCPVIASAIPVVNEIVEHGINGWLVAPNDPKALAEGILRLLNDDALRAELRAGGARTLPERYNPAILTAQIEQVYRAAIAAVSLPNSTSQPSLPQSDPLSAANSTTASTALLPPPQPDLEAAPSPAPEPLVQLPDPTSAPSPAPESTDPASAVLPLKQPDLAPPAAPEAATLEPTSEPATAAEPSPELISRPAVEQTSEPAERAQPKIDQQARPSGASLALDPAPADTATPPTSAHRPTNQALADASPSSTTSDE